MKNIFIFTLALTLFACKGTKEKEETTNVEVIMTKHGADISTDNAIEMDQFEELFSGKDSLELKLVGTIEDVCQTKGCWMTLFMDDSSTMMVRFKDYEFFVPKDAQGKIAVIDGFAKVDTISVADRKHYMEDNNASQAEIDAITEPEITYSFEASGVIIKDEIIHD